MNIKQQQKIVIALINSKHTCSYFFTRLAVASDKAYLLLAHGRWFSPGTPAFPTNKTDPHDI